MCLCGRNLNFIRNIVARCSYQAYRVCLAVCMSGGLCMTPIFVHPLTSVHPSIHLYALLYICMPPYIPPHVCMVQDMYIHPYICMPPVHPPICLYALYICTLPIHLYAPSTSPDMSSCPKHMYTTHTSVHL